MQELIVPALITGVFSIVVSLISVWWRDYLEKRKKERSYAEAVSEQDLQKMVEVQKWLDEVREELNFDRACIFQFHNGGNYASGQSIKRFSMTYESCRPGIASIKRGSQNLLATEHPKWVEKMFKEDIFVCDVNHTDDDKAREDLEFYGIKQTATVPVRSISGHLVGFLACHTILQELDFKELENALIDDAAEIAGYLLIKNK